MITKKLWFRIVVIIMLAAMLMSVFTVALEVIF